MVKDVDGNELRENDIVKVDVTDTTRITGVIKEFHSGKGRSQSKRFMRVAFQYDVPIESDDPMEGVERIIESGTYAAKPARVSKASKSARRA